MSPQEIIELAELALKSINEEYDMVEIDEGQGFYTNYPVQRFSDNDDRFVAISNALNYFKDIISQK